MILLFGVFRHEHMLEIELLKSEIQRMQIEVSGVL